MEIIQLNKTLTHLLLYILIHKLNIIGADFKQTLMLKIETCIGFHSFYHVYGSFNYHPCYVDHLIGKGVEPSQTTNY